MKPEFFEDQKMAEAGPIAALVYQALWVSADDTGMAMCDPELLKGKMFARWSAVGVPEITGALRKLHELGRVRFFQGGDELFAQIVRWKENQPVHKPSKFNYRDDYAKRGKELQETVPAWCGTSEVPVRHSPPPRHLDSQTPRHLETIKAADAAEALFQRFWSAYPKRAGGNPKKKARHAWDARIKDGVDLEVLITAAERYARYCDATEKTGTEFVKQAQFWLSTSNEGWLESWDFPADASGDAPAFPDHPIPLDDDGR